MAASSSNIACTSGGGCVRSLARASASDVKYTAWVKPPSPCRHSNPPITSGRSSRNGSSDRRISSRPFSRSV